MGIAEESLALQRPPHLKRKTLMKVLLPLSLVAALVASPVFAECVVPQNEVKIPNGSKATMDEMLATKHAIQEANTSVEAYAACIKAEQDAKIAAGGPDMKDEEKVKISTAYAARQNEQVEKLQALADRFNVEVRAFKAKQAATSSAAEDAQSAADANAAKAADAAKAKEQKAAQKAADKDSTPTQPKSN
jgi:hypothetical protein